MPKKAEDIFCGISEAAQKNKVTPNRFFVLFRLQIVTKGGAKMAYKED